jgi:N-acyl homoserine lactone hydrolase
MMTTKDTLRLYIFACGYLEAKAVPFITSSGAVEEVTTRYFSGCYLVRHPQGLLLWDTGLADALYASPTGYIFGPWRMMVTKTLSSYLTALNIAPQDVTHLAFSHMHGDHTGNANLFATATVLLNTHEHAAAFGANPPPGYDTASYTALKESQLIRIHADYDVFGDGTVVIVEAPGHTVGHQVLMLKLPNMGPVILAGDLYYSSVDRAERRVPKWNFSYEHTLRSMERLEALTHKHRALLLIQHDMEQMATLPHAPAYLA